MEWGIVSAPSNLGLRPPEPSSVPGTLRAPEALREAGLVSALVSAGAVERGAVLPGRYRDDPRPGEALRNHDAIVDHARRLAVRLDEVVAIGRRPLVLGGDCSLLVGAALHLRRRGRFGLLHVDGHTDFRHPGNSSQCASLAGEDLAVVVGRHWPGIADLDGLGPYIRTADVVHLGCRDDDEELAEVSALLAATLPASLWRADPAGCAELVGAVLWRVDLAGYWVHVDVDVLDPSVMPAVDSPDPGGIDAHELVALLRLVLPRAAGLQLCVFDPDLDPDGRYARLLRDIVVAALVEA